MQKALKLALRLAFSVMAIGTPAWMGGCGNDVALESDGHDDGSGGAGGASPAERCKAACAVTSECAGVPASICQQVCENTSEGACVGYFNAWLGCLTQNAAKLSSCGIETVCDAAFNAFSTCQKQHSPTDAAAMSAGSGGGVGGCDQPSCDIGYGGLTCGCTQTCSGTKRQIQCDSALGGHVCACTAGGTYLGSCIGKGCDPATNCCASHF